MAVPTWHARPNHFSEVKAEGSELECHAMRLNSLLAISNKVYQNHDTFHEQKSLSLLHFRDLLVQFVSVYRSSLLVVVVEHYAHLKRRGDLRLSVMELLAIRML